MLKRIKLFPSFFFSFTFLLIFEFGALTYFEEWTKSCQKIIEKIEQEETLCQEIIAKSRKEPSIKENQTNQAINNVLNLRNQLITFKWIVKKFPKNKLIKMSKRRLNEPVFRAISLCKQAMECVSQSDWKSRKAHLGELMAKIHSIISGLRTEFGTLVVEVELQFFNENDLTLRNKQILEQQLDKITAFLHKNKTYCAMEYFGLAKAALGNVPNANDTEKRADFKIYHIIQNLVMDAKVSIWGKKLSIKSNAYKNVQMNGAETFMHDFQSEWLLIGRVNFYWGDRDKMLSYSNKAKKLVETANELFGPLKQVVVQFLDHQISKAKKLNETITKLIDDKKNFEDFREEFLKNYVDKFIGNVLKAMRLIDTPQYNQISGKVAEVKEAANELANSFNNLQKVREKIKELRRLLKKEKRSFEGPYQLLFT
ncbi:hypothetical protein GPALN_003440 [Globodera pallida]|nr:hypothetical protein GPALN_003440 [Globodera pallida]